MDPVTDASWGLSFPRWTSQSRGLGYGSSSSSSSPAARRGDADNGDVAHASRLREKGLANERGDNHCFLNVVIQALWNLQSFRRRLQSAPDHPHPLRHGEAGGQVGDAAAGLSGMVDLAPENCCYCALKDVFLEYSVSEADTLPPDALRLALSSVYNQQGRFQLGEMEDATETIEAILGILHACNVRSPEQVAADHQAHQANGRRLSHAERVEQASDFGCHPLCLGHEVFGLEYVDLPRCTFCGATGEPSVSGSYLYSAYVTELLDAQSRPAAPKQDATEMASDPLGLLQDSVLSLTSSLAGKRPPSLQDALHALCQREDSQKCGECNSRKTLMMERWLTRQPKIFTVSLAWPSSSPGRDAIWIVLSMIRPKLLLEQIFKTAKSRDSKPSDSGSWSEADADSEYCFHGLICYYGMHYIAIFWCPARKCWVLFDDTFVREKEDWSSVASLIMSGQYLPTLIFYESLADVPADAESLEELSRQVDGLEDRQSSCVAM